MIFIYLVAIASPAAWLCQALLFPKWLSSLLQDGLDSLLEFTVVGDTTPLDDFVKEFWEKNIEESNIQVSFEILDVEALQ